jgi:hypothetical protein
MSRYHTLYDTTGTAKFKTLATGAASTSTVVTARRITLFTTTVPQFVAFGTSTVVATTSSAVVPANACVDYNFVSGQYVAVLSSNGVSSITILDSD